MRHIIYVFLVFFSIPLHNIQAQGISFFEGSFEEALELAKEEEKLVFVDAYATWCGPCKRMAKSVFPDQSVGEYYNQHYISMKIDMEKTKGRSFGQKFPVSAYPTLFYINEKGELLKKVIGGKTVEQFLTIGKNIANTYDRSGELAELYKEGNRDFDVVLKYVKALNNANKPSLKVANDYLRENIDISDEQRAEFIYESLTAADSRIFDLFINERDLIESLYGLPKVEDKIEEACWKTIENAIDFDASFLLEDAKLKMKYHNAQRHIGFSDNADYEYAKATANTSLLAKAAIQLSKNSANNDHEKLFDICNELLLYKNLDGTLTDSSEKIAKMAVDLNPSSEYLFTYSKILAENNKQKKALKSAQKAIDASENYQEIKEIKEWIDSFKN